MIRLCVTLTRQQLLTDNDRLHHMAKAAKVKVLRTKARYAALADRASIRPVDTWPVTVRVVYQFPTGRHPTDANNLAATTKALVDGVTDSGLIFPDDSTTYVEGQDSRINPEPSRDPRGLVRAVITVRPVCQHCAA